MACSINSESTQNEPVVQQDLKAMVSDSTSESLDWEAYQDSLRSVLLKLKPDNFLKGSMLEEFYIRNLISVSGGELVFDLRFDLHAFDCGAPDCYSTDIKFGIPHNNQLQFPNELTFSIHEHGCVDTERRATGVMRLVEKGTTFVNYYSRDQQSNLVILGADKDKAYAYYFTGVEPDSIKADQIPEVIMNLSDTAAVPYRSTQLLTLEYERFFTQ
ncbi:hypothetical protein JMN32_08720 [Fulvivirga sp. 29W222]|uniref:Uncharacterized protein n=1 Tax=Fulvivirga marina TaxID=2494733 RepID=A0A937KDM5_9BACT|nr:hypothetical protein [Fulvivirga marina]MBL6446388.1 hypothetical protein [Fulvivirga marina]